MREQLEIEEETRVVKQHVRERTVYLTEEEYNNFLSMFIKGYSGIDNDYEKAQAYIKDMEQYCDGLELSSITLWVNGNHRNFGPPNDVTYYVRRDKEK